MYQPNDRIGSYILIREIGRGAFGAVWLAERRGSLTTTKVALKIALARDLDLESIRQEANLWVQASGHPNVLPIIEADLYDGKAIIVSEYAADGSLADWLEKLEGKATPVTLAVEIACGILAGLEHLHSKQIIHRDIKPANILLQSMTPRLADFGIARMLMANTQSTLIKGTPAYMAPEAFEGERSIQTDLWSVGAILYKLLSGQLPFPQKNSASVMFAIVNKDPQLLDSIVPAPLREIAFHSLNKNPKYRFQSASSMREALLRAKRYILDEEETIIRLKKEQWQQREAFEQAGQPVFRYTDRSTVKDRAENKDVEIVDYLKLQRIQELRQELKGIVGAVKPTYERREIVCELQQTSRDYTKFDLSIGHSFFGRLSKRELAYQVAREAVRRGLSPEQIRAILSWRQGYLWAVVDGLVNQQQFIEKARIANSLKGRKFDSKRFFTADDKLIYWNNRTYAFTNQWGTSTLEAVDLIIRAVKDDDITYSPSSF